jgi:transcriptional regulator with XRE-family HTH domain
MVKNMNFSEKLKKVMQELNINQRQVCGIIGKSKGSVSQYLSGKQTPSEDAQRDIAVSLGLAPDYFSRDDENPSIQKMVLQDGVIKRLLPEDAAKLMGVEKRTVRLGLQQGVFPWGYAIKTSETRWTYFINARRFAEIEGVTV